VGSNAWKDSVRTTYTYNVSSQLTVQLDETWRTNSWQNYSRETSTYNSSNSTTLWERWDTIANRWKNSWFSTFTNNADGTVDHIVGQEWDTLSATWRVTGKETYTYDSDKNVTEILDRNWHNNKWEDAAKLINTYNAAGKQLTSLHQAGYDTGTRNHLVNDWRWTNTYDNNNYLTTFLFQVWDDSPMFQWVNASQWFYTNKPDGKVYQIFTQTWFMNEWIDESRQTFSYTTGCTLPLTLLDFSAVRINNTVSVNWKTLNEVNTSHFIVQRSLDATLFIDISKVAAKGNSAGQNYYTYTDNIADIKTGKLYYRLIMADKDGKSVVSKIVGITLDVNSDDLAIMPNPAKNYFIIAPSHSYGSVNATVMVYDCAGHVVIRQNVTAGEQRINISFLSKGLYTVRVITKDGAKMQKLVVE
jgi:hypothetical protein